MQTDGDMLAVDFDVSTRLEFKIRTPGLRREQARLAADTYLEENGTIDAWEYLTEYLAAGSAVYEWVVVYQAL